MDHYIVAYGSLLSSASKNRTDPNTGPNIPAEIRGFSREWNCRGTSISFSTTFLGTVANQNDAFNAAFFKVPSSDSLGGFDAREEFYCREEVSRDMIILLESSFEASGFKEPPPGQYWIYVTRPEDTEVPSWEYPIVQSYVDIFISGCLEIQAEHQLENYAQSCIQTTREWAHAWVNDRIHPRRPALYQPQASSIDRLLYQNIQNAFEAIKIE